VTLILFVSVRVVRGSVFCSKTQYVNYPAED